MADDFIQRGGLNNLKKYYGSWQELKSAHDATYHDARYREVEASDGWGTETERYFLPDIFEYLIFKDKSVTLSESMRDNFAAIQEKLRDLLTQ